MMWRKPFRQLVIILPLLLVYQQSMAGGPWTQPKHKGIFIANVSPNIYSTISGKSGGIALNRRVTDLTTQFYVEYGIINSLTLIANLPLKYERTGNSVRSGGDFAQTLPASWVFGVGNASVELKVKAFHKNRFASAVSFGVETPSPWYENATGLRMGYDCWSLLPTIHLGGGITERLYVQGSATFAVRTNNYSHEWRAAAEIGYRLKKKPLWLAFLLQAKQSIRNGSRNDANILTSNNLQTGLYLNDEGYWAWAFKMAYNINNRLGINVALAGGITTTYIARTPAISAGVFYDWSKPKGKG